MKRRKISSRRGRTTTVEISHSIQTQPSFSDLPMDILLNILLRLSVKRIFIFKSVCKTWYDLVSDPQFAKLHFDQAEVYPLIRTSWCRYGSKMLYLVQPDKDDFELKLGMCDCDHTLYEPGCVCNVQVKIDTQFEIPEKFGLSKHYNLHRYGMVNSCNGFLCLFNLLDKWLRPPIVCNPITGEFINLPEANKIDLDFRNVCYGFGFSPVTNQYKVIRMFHQGTGCVNKAEVHILGTITWKEIGFLNQPMPNSLMTYFNGFLYWSSSKLGPLSIFSFDIEIERFESVSAPPVNQLYRYDNMGVLGGELSLCGALDSGTIHVWILKDTCTGRAWSKALSFDHISSIPEVWVYGSFQPIKYLNDGALLMFYPRGNALVYMDPKSNRFRYLKICRTGLRFQAIPYIPSFISMKHALSGQNVKVLNVRSKGAKLKLRREADMDIVEQRVPEDNFI